MISIFVHMMMKMNQGSKSVQLQTNAEFLYLLTYACGGRKGIMRKKQYVKRYFFLTYIMQYGHCLIGLGRCGAWIPADS